MSQKCIKCGELHGMGIENMETHDVEPIEYCRECLFPHNTYNPIYLCLESLDNFICKKEEE